MYLNVRCLICVFKAFVWKIRQGNNALTDINIWIIATFQLLCWIANLVSYHSHIAIYILPRYIFRDKYMFPISKCSIVKQITHIITLLSFSEWGSLWESGMLLKRNLNSYTICPWWTNSQIAWMQCGNLSFAILFFNRYILCHNGYKPCEHRDIEIRMYLSLSQNNWNECSSPHLSKLSQCDTSL